MGESVRYKIRVSNTGPVPLSHAVVQDTYDHECMSFLSAPGMATAFAPGFLQWDIPNLAVGEAQTWEVVLEVTNICWPVGLDNCAIADGEGPQGQPAHDEACVHFEAESPTPEFTVTKRLVDPQGAPVVGRVTQYEIVVRKTGNTTLAFLETVDNWDTDCQDFVSAIPAPDAMGQGFIRWENVGPLPPGDAAVLNVFLRPRDACLPDGLRNCGRAFWMVDGAKRITGVDDSYAEGRFGVLVEYGVAAFNDLEARRLTAVEESP